MAFFDRLRELAAAPGAARERAGAIAALEVDEMRVPAPPATARPLGPPPGPRTRPLDSELPGPAPRPLAEPRVLEPSQAAARVAPHPAIERTAPEPGAPAPVAGIELDGSPGRLDAAHPSTEPHAPPPSPAAPPAPPVAPETPFAAPAAPGVDREPAAPPMPERRATDERHPSTRPTHATREAPVPPPHQAPAERAREALAEVRRWMETPPPLAPAGRVEAPRRDSVPDAAVPSPPRSAVVEERTELSIGTIQVTVEPPPAAAPRRVVRPSAKPPAARREAVPRDYLRGW